MLNTLKNLFSILTPSQKRTFYAMQVLNIIVSLFEVIGIASIGPFVLLVSEPSNIQTNAFLNQLYQLSPAQNPQSFLIMLGGASFLLLLAGALLQIFAVWRLTAYAQTLGAEINDRLTDYYLNQPWHYHAQKNSAFFIKQITDEVSRVVFQIGVPFMDMNARLLLIIFMITGLLFINPYVVGLTIATLVPFYVLIFYVVRKRITNHSQAISKQLTQRMQLLNEGFGGIKTSLLHRCQSFFIQPLKTNYHQMAQSHTWIATYSRAPRYLVEMVVIGLVFIALAFLMAAYSNDNSQVLAILSIFSIAGLKLLPAFNQIYASISQIQGGASALESIKKDLNHAQSTAAPTYFNLEPIPFNKSLQLQDIHFGYTPEKPTLSKLKLSIPVNQSVGIVGASGSGKTTIVDILMGLLKPEKGRMLIDDQPIDSDEKMAAWQRLIGYVPQDIFLSDQSIRENITFGIPNSKVDTQTLNQTVQLARLNAFINSLPNGLDTLVGERGVQLSGGQRQRIGIARALYRQASVLVFDEATSALDGLTEKAIMDAIHDFSGKKTLIIIAHRLKTVKPCDIIYLIDNGCVVDQGSYHELLSRNAQFKTMVEHA